MTPTDVPGWIHASPWLVLLILAVLGITALLERTATWDELIDRLLDLIAR